MAAHIARRHLAPGAVRRRRLQRRRGRLRSSPRSVRRLPNPRRKIASFGAPRRWRAFARYVAPPAPRHRAKGAHRFLRPWPAAPSATRQRLDRSPSALIWAWRPPFTAPVTGPRARARTESSVYHGRNHAGGRAVPWAPNPNAVAAPARRRRRRAARSRRARAAQRRRRRPARRLRRWVNCHGVPPRCYATVESPGVMPQCYAPLFCPGVKPRR